MGFTGTREGLTEDQYLSLRTLLSDKLNSPADWFHHGDCIGADSDSHDIVRSVSHARIMTHPPDKDVIRAFRKGDMALKPKPYLVRNRDIVDGSDELIACPEGPEKERSGTWSTVRYARKSGKPITIVWPSGLVEKS